MTELFPPRHCIQCNLAITNGQAVRSIHPTKNLIHPQVHHYPDGVNASGKAIRNSCAETHNTDPEIHDSCKEAWAKANKVKVPPPYKGEHYTDVALLLDRAKAEANAQPLWKKVLRRLGLRR
jgi:hypothetical protein